MLVLYNVCISCKRDCKEGLLVLRVHLKALQVSCFIKEHLNGSLWEWLPCLFSLKTPNIGY